MADLNPQKRRRADIAVGLVTLLLPLTVPAMGILWKCVLWAITWLMVLDFVQIQIEWLGRLSLQKKVFVFLVATVVLLTFVFDPIYASWRSEQAALTSGVLHPLSNKSQPLPAIQVGQGGTVFYLTDPKGTLFNFPSDSLRVREERGELLLSTTVRDKSGNLVVEVVDNHWTVSPSTTNC
jgi:hypothetical protein